MNQDRYWPLDRAAELLDVPPSNIRLMASRGDVKAEQRNGEWWVAQSSIDELNALRTRQLAARRRRSGRDDPPDARETQAIFQEALGKSEWERELAAKQLDEAAAEHDRARSRKQAENLRARAAFLRDRGDEAPPPEKGKRGRG